MLSYRSSGLHIASELPVPQLIPDARSPDGADVVIRRGEVPAAVDAPLWQGPTGQANASDLLLEVHGVARYLARGGNEIIVQAEAGQGDADIGTFLMAAVLGAIHYQRDAVVLHAGAVVRNGRAVVFCGESGAGKSTTAAGLQARGYEALCDDQCVITPGPDRTSLLRPDCSGLKLWAAAMDHLSIPTEGLTPIRAGLQKYLVPNARAADDTPVPVAAIFVLRQHRPPDQPGMETFNIADALTLMRSFTYRSVLVKSLNLETRQLTAMAGAGLGRRVPVFRQTRPWGLKHLERQLDVLEGYMDELEAVTHG